MSQTNKWNGFSRPVGNQGKNLPGQPRPGYSREASGIGEVVSEYITRSVIPRQSDFSAIAGAWEELVPADVRSHCAFRDFSEGQLVVMVDSPAYLYEMQLRRDELLQEIQRRLRSVRREITEGMDTAQITRRPSIRRLKFTAG
jgi:hypothetical protein